MMVQRRGGGGSFSGDTRTSLSVLSRIVVLFVLLAGENWGDKGSRKWLASFWQDSLVRHHLWLWVTGCFLVSFSFQKWWINESIGGVEVVAVFVMCDFHGCNVPRIGWCQLHCPLANSLYATIREEENWRVSIYIKTVERSTNLRGRWKKKAGTETDWLNISKISMTKRGLKKLLWRQWDTRMVEVVKRKVQTKMMKL